MIKLDLILLSVAAPIIIGSKRDIKCSIKILYKALERNVSLHLTYTP